ncbi:MAG TPA: helix-turn-helix transcriptional regulator [Verrucomicrobiae bacterium]|nr:helix-turn-helix transcriptional regulator [Verrucomicrobiae bacterium]
METSRIHSVTESVADPVGDQITVNRINLADAALACRGWHRHSYFEIYWITAGHGEQRTDFGIHPLTAGTLAFVSAGQSHSWSFEDDLRGYRVGFSPWGVSEAGGVRDELPFFFGPNNPRTLKVPAAHHAGFEHEFQTLLGELESADPLRHDAARALLGLLLIRCQRVCAQVAPGSSGETAAARLARRFWWEVNKNYLKQRQVRDYAARLQVTANHLIETLRKEFGKTPGDLIDERLYIEAVRMLLHTTRSVAEIAYSLEFKSPSHFGAYFKRHAGCSPGEVRRRFAGGFTGQSMTRDTQGSEANIIAA